MNSLHLGLFCNPECLMDLLKEYFRKDLSFWKVDGSRGTGSKCEATLKILQIMFQRLHLSLQLTCNDSPCTDANFTNTLFLGTLDHRARVLSISSLKDNSLGAFVKSEKGKSLSSQSLTNIISGASCDAKNWSNQ